MLNTRVTEEREVPLWAIAAPAIGVPLMVVILALTAPKHETPVDPADLDATTEQVESQAADHAFGLSPDCTEQTSSS